MTFTEKQVEEFIKLSYFAGIIDGEGCIGIERLSAGVHRKRAYYCSRLTVINTDENLMKLLVGFFKGSYNTRKKIEGRKTCYRWHVFGKNQVYALQKLIPFLFIKKAQALLLIEYNKTMKRGRKLTDEILAEREVLWLQCKVLNS